MIQFNKAEGQRILELGGGSNRHFQTDVNVDTRPVEGVDFVADFNEPLPIQTGEFDAVFCQYTLEHISWRRIKSFLSEICRVLKPGGMVVIITANTEEQVKWIGNNPNGWDGKDLFESASCVLFGDQDYPENSHRCYFSPSIIAQLFWGVPFENVTIQPAGERKTDLIVTAMKPKSEESKTIQLTEQQQKQFVPNVLGTNAIPTSVEQEVKEEAKDLPPAEELYDKFYFNGGGKVGGYAREGYWDYPVHNITAKHVLDRKPESVLELGCARGYILKRIQDAGVGAAGLEVSKHCFMTRVADNIVQHDIGLIPWNVGHYYDLCFSIATLEHIPEHRLKSVIGEMVRTCKRGLHGVDFGKHDDGFDKTHCTLRPREWWLATFSHYAPGWPVEIVDKEELEKGDLPQSFYDGDGKKKLNIGSFTTMFHNGWTNIDVHDLMQFAMHYKYDFKMLDVRNGLPYGTSTVDAIYCAHMLEHITYEEGLKFLRECRRVIRPDGAMRFLVPDAGLLNGMYWDEPSKLDNFDEINDGCAKARTPAAKLWSLLHEGHAACYDTQTLVDALEEAGFAAKPTSFRKEGFAGAMTSQILRETLDCFPCLTLYVDAVPRLS